MSDTFLQEVEAEIAKRGGPKGRVLLWLFRLTVLLLCGGFVTAGLAANGVESAHLFGVTIVLVLIWLRGKKS